MKKYFFPFLKEMFPVVVGILIALFINNWNQDRKDRMYLNGIMNSIELELEETQNDIDSIIILQYALVDTLKIYLEDEQTSLQRIMEKTNGVSIPSIRIHSWKALSSSKIELLNYQDLSSLANIEEDKELLREKSKYLMNYLYDNIGEKSRYKKAKLIGLLIDLVSTQNSILSEINELTKRLHSNDTKAQH